MNKNGQTLTSRNIIQSLQAHREDLDRFGVLHIGIFGSYRQGTQRRGSDLDFLVAFRTTTFDNYMDLKFFLERLFRRRVDLVTEGSLKPALRRVKAEAMYA